MTDTSPTASNMYLTTPLAALYAKTAGPIILITFSNGLYTVVDGWFIGRYVGPEALSAVTMVFPLFMMLIALGTLVSSGFSSVFARYFGAGNKELGEQSMLSAAVLSIFICALLMGLYELWGLMVVEKIANGSAPLAQMGDTYLSLTIFYSPLFFMIALLSDSLRCQGHLAFMTLMAISANIFNMIFNYLLIVELDMGVAGSAYGTALAQGTSVMAVLAYLYLRRDTARFRFDGLSKLTLNWGQFLSLGAPTSLTYVGVSALTGAAIFQIQVWNAETYEVTVAAYGIITRLLTFGYMPILGMTLAQQAIVGNNFGAREWLRAYSGLKFSLAVAFIYCITLQVIFIAFPAQIAGIFVDSPAVQAETARILPYIAALYALFGPLIMLPGFFQAVGDARRAALLGLTKVYLINLPLILIMPSFFGEIGIWYAAPLAEIAALALSAIVVLRIFNKQGNLINWMTARQD
jgi:putative MATE family efflux protein